MSDSLPRVVILLSEAERGCAVRQALARKGIDSQVVSTSDDLHRRLLSRNVDLVIIEQALGGFLSGIEILERAKLDLSQPCGIIVGKLSPKELDAARRLGIASAVAPQADPDQIVAIAIAKLSQLTQGDSRIPVSARRLVSEMDVIRPWPQLLTELCTYLQDDSASLSKLADDISLDPRVTAELLKVANSTASGLAKRLAGVTDAVKMLGVRGTIATVLSTGIQSAQSALSAALPVEIQTWYQNRSVLLASTAECVAGGMHGLSADTGQLLGLFQDLGILVLANAHPRNYASALRRVRSIGQVRLECLEGEEFGITHADVSAALLQKWKVPQWLVLMVLDHHSPEARGDRSEMELGYRHVMRIAEATANLADVPSPYRRRALSVEMVEAEPRNMETCKASIAKGVARAGEFSKRFSVPAPDEATVRQLVAELESVLDLGPDSRSEAPVADPTPPPEATVSATVVPGRRQRVLVVDDESAVIRLIRNQLATAGFEVVSCDNPEDAGKLCAEVDILLCDVHLRGVNGLDVIRKLRESGFQAPVIMVSGDRSRNTVVDCIEAGVVDFLIKPFSRAMLIEKLTRHLAS